MQIHRYDVVIVGAGGAGMRAALESSTRARTAVLTKLYPTRSHTGAAQGGMCAALANVEEDNWEWHTFDTIKGGDYLVDQDAAEIMCKEAIDAVIDLEKMGLPFNRTPEGRIDQRRFGGHTRNHGEAAVRRACYAADRTGHMILQTLYQNCIKQDVEFFNEFYVLDLVMTEDGERTAGVVAYELATGEIHVFRAKSVVFATGGFGKVFKTTSNAHTLTGDGMGIIWRKGLPLEDMEFYQFHPTGLAGLGMLLTEGARGEGGILRNKDGERFMERYAPTIKDLAPRDMVARAMVQEVREGRGAGPEGLRLPRPHAPARGADRDETARTSPSSPAPTWAWTRSPNSCRCSPPRTTPWAASRPTSRPRSCATTTPWFRACTRPASAPVSASTAPTGSAPTRCSTSTCSAAGRVSPPRSTRSSRTPRPAGEPRRVRGRPRVGLRDSTGGERVGEIRKAMQETMDMNAQVYRTEATLKQALSDVQELQRGSATWRSTTRASGTTPSCSRPSSSGSCSISPRSSSSGRWSARSPEAGTPARTTRPATM
jgi:succinate dehydrogenase / fumarate reductase flavoprotein subunit